MPRRRVIDMRPPSTLACIARVGFCARQDTRCPYSIDTPQGEAWHAGRVLAQSGLDMDAGATVRLVRRGTVAIGAHTVAVLAGRVLNSNSPPRSTV